MEQNKQWHPMKRRRGLSSQAMAFLEFDRRIRHALGLPTVTNNINVHSTCAALLLALLCSSRILLDQPLSFMWLELS